MARSPGPISSRRGSTLGSVLCYQPDCARWHLRVRAKAKKLAANSLSQELRPKEKASTQASRGAGKHASTQASTAALDLAVAKHASTQAIRQASKQEPNPAIQSRANYKMQTNKKASRQESKVTIIQNRYYIQQGTDLVTK